MNFTTGNSDPTAIASASSIRAVCESGNSSSNRGFTYQRALLNNGQRLHLHQGPIDLLIDIESDQASRDRAFDLMEATFDGLLTELVRELPALRDDVALTARGASNKPFTGLVAQRMWCACQRIFPIVPTGFSPMAAVAGAVADHVLQAAMTVDGVRRLWINNGGDIAVHLASDQHFDCAISDYTSSSNSINHYLQSLHPQARIDASSAPLAEPYAGKIRIYGTDAIGGIATSGRHGRSFSLGIADSVTVLADNAALADCAATLIANAVDLPGHAAIERCLAKALDPDTDLRDRAVVTNVGSLSMDETLTALELGVAEAERFVAADIAKGVLLTLNAVTTGVGEHRPFQASDGKRQREFPELNCL